LKITLKTFQADFLSSQARFPAFIAGWATGKTMMLLLKVWKYCEENPGSLWWIVRKEFIDLQDSTMKDFQDYFNVTIPSSREFPFPNKSLIVFRHGGEVNRNNLKNVNLSGAGIEQVEEFETDEEFQLIRGRLRRKDMPYHQIAVTGNTAGHNWVWKLWKNNPPDPKKYPLSEAITYDNADNLSKDYIDDLDTMQAEAPNQYQRYVMNSWEEAYGDDYLFTWEFLNQSCHLQFPNQSEKRIIGVDCALFGDNKTAFCVIKDTGHDRWEQIRGENEAYQGKDSSWIFGKYVELRKETLAHYGVIDADGGYGDGTISRCKEVGLDVVSYHANETPKHPDLYINKRTEDYYTVKQMIEAQTLKILSDQELIDELLTIRFKYRQGKRILISKEEMRVNGVKSPDKADALMMAVSAIHKAITTKEARERYTPEKQVSVNAGFGFAGKVIK